jgi:hypothetical protein
MLDPTDHDQLELVEELQVSVLAELGVGDAHVDITQRIREGWRRLSSLGLSHQ